MHEPAHFCFCWTNNKKAQNFHRVFIKTWRARKKIYFSLKLPSNFYICLPCTPFPTARGPGPVDHHPALHGRPPRAQVPHHGEGQHVRHDQGHRHPRKELHQVQGVPGGADDGHGPAAGDLPKLS